MRVAAEVTRLELILQEAAEGTEELICPLITRISADGLPHDPRPSAPSAENSALRVVAHSDIEQLANLAL